MSAAGRMVSVSPRRSAVVRYAGLIATKGSGAVAALMLNALLARVLVPEQAGTLFFCIALATFASLIARLGMDIACLRHIAALPRRARLRCLDWAIGLALLANVPVILTGLVVIHFAAATRGQVMPASVLFTAATLGLSLANIGAETLKARGWVGEGLFWQSAMQPAVALLLIGLAGTALPTVVVCFVVAYGVAGLGALIQAWDSLRGRSRERGDSAALGWRSLLALGLPLMGIAVMNAVIELSDTLLLGALRSAAEVSVYYICAKLAALSTLLLFIINGSIGPQLSRRWAAGEQRACFALVRRYSRYMLGLALLVLVLLAGLRPWLLALFGAEYVARGSFALLVLAIGYFSVLAAGPLGVFMTMTGHQRGYLHNNLAACGLNLVLNLALIPTYGVNGACFATAVALCAKNVLLFFQFRSIRKGALSCRPRKRSSTEPTTATTTATCCSPSSFSASSRTMAATGR